MADVYYWVAFAYWKIVIIVEGLLTLAQQSQNGAEAGTFGWRSRDWQPSALRRARGGERLTSARMAH